MYCKICREELEPEEEAEGICDSCKASWSRDFDDEEDFIDPGVT